MGVVPPDGPVAGDRHADRAHWAAVPARLADVVREHDTAGGRCLRASVFAGAQPSEMPSH
jgi:hypothetical protein